MNGGNQFEFVHIRCFAVVNFNAAFFIFKDPPVIILSGSGKLESATRLFKPGVLFKQGVVEFLAKPINQEQLLGALNKALNKG